MLNVVQDSPYPKALPFHRECVVFGIAAAASTVSIPPPSPVRANSHRRSVSQGKSSALPRTCRQRSNNGVLQNRTVPPSPVCRAPHDLSSLHYIGKSEPGARDLLPCHLRDRHRERKLRVQLVQGRDPEKQSSRVRVRLKKTMNNDRPVLSSCMTWMHCPAAALSSEFGFNGRSE